MNMLIWAYLKFKVFFITEYGKIKSLLDWMFAALKRRILTNNWIHEITLLRVIRSHINLAKYDWIIQFWNILFLTLSNLLIVVSKQNTYVNNQMNKSNTLYSVQIWWVDKKKGNPFAYEKGAFFLLILNYSENKIWTEIFTSILKSHARLSPVTLSMHGINVPEWEKLKKVNPF